MFTFNTTHKQVLGDLHTPVSIYLKVRDIYPESALLESSDFHGNENSLSYIALCPLASIGINNGDNILVRDVTFRRFRVESLRCGMLFNFRVCFNKKYCSAPGRGIENVTVDGLTYNGRQPNMSIMAGYNEERKIKGVKINGLVINGTPIYDTMPGKPAWYKTSDFANIFIGEHVEDVTFNQ